VGALKTAPVVMESSCFFRHPAIQPIQYSWKQERKKALCLRMAVAVEALL